MEETEKLPSCKQTDCLVRESGKCLEGLKLEECDHFYLAEPGEEELGETPEKKDAAKVIRLFDGLELKINGLDLVTNQFDTNLVIIIGESNSGKTTILTSIFDMFQVGKFRKYFFAGSMTQYGFEIRCHLSRAPSNAGDPETDKTTSKDFNFLHIAFKDATNLAGGAFHLLLSDISGERFKMANNSATVMKEMELVKQADHLIYLLDGDKIADKFKRNAIFTRAAQFITRALDTGIFDHNTKLLIVFTKGDKLQNMLTSGQLEQIKSGLKERFLGKLGELEFELIAARPKPPTAEFAFGHGLEDLLTRWKARESREEAEPPPMLTSNRYFDLFKVPNG